MAATTISRASVGTDDDGSGTTGTAINAAWVGTAIYDGVDALFTSLTGIRLNQGAGDGAIVSLESSDIAHGMTAVENTDVYGTLGKQSATDGGLRVTGLTEVTTAISLAAQHTTGDTTKSTAAIGAVVVNGALKSGTGVSTMTANSNIVTFANNSTTRFILDADGDSHQDVGTAWTNFDAFDDVALLNALTGVVSRAGDPLRDAFGALVADHRASLVAHRIVTINDGPGEDGSVFVNWSRFHMLMIGAVRQIAREMSALQQRTLALEGR
jgi:hypothetical protein